MTPLARLTASLALALALPLAAQTTASLPAAKVAAIERRITAEMSRQNIPGLTVAIAQGDSMRWSNGYGLADLENYVPAKASTRIRLASISKALTAIGVLQLAERGKLRIDDPVTRYLPEYPYPAVTLRHLLSHTSGVRQWDEAHGDIRSTRYYPTLGDALGLFMRDPLLFAPGERYFYTTYGYTLLGVVMEKAAGVSYSDYMREHVFVPAGAFSLEADSVFHIVPNRARGYHRNPQGDVENAELADTSYKIPGGVMLGTSEDLVKIAMALNAGNLLEPSSGEAMWTRQKLNDGSATHYGLGWAIAELDGQIMVGHNGAQQGTSTALQMLPREGVAAAVMMNRDGANPMPLVEEILRILLQ